MPHLPLPLPRLPMPRLPMPRALHTSARPSTTAQFTTFGRALELNRPVEERIVTDEYAPAFLTGAATRLLDPLARVAGPVRRVERSEFASINTSVLCRHRFIDEHMLATLPDVAQVVILGAGYDSRAYRFPQSIGTRPVYEVDLAPLSRRKAAIVDARPELFGRSRVTRVEIDFRTDSLPERLLRHGFERGARTFVVWEGVSMYLTRDAVRATLESLALVCGPASTVAMDFWRHVGGLGVYDQLRRIGEQGVRLIGEPMTFATDPSRAAVLLNDAGFEVADVATAELMTKRYATAGRSCDQGMFVAAARVR